MVDRIAFWKEHVLAGISTSTLTKSEQVPLAKLHSNTLDSSDPALSLSKSQEIYSPPTSSKEDLTKEDKRLKKGFFGTLKTFVSKSTDYSDSESEKYQKKDPKKKKKKKEKVPPQELPPVRPPRKAKLPTPKEERKEYNDIPFAETDSIGEVHPAEPVTDLDIEQPLVSSNASMDGTNKPSKGFSQIPAKLKEVTVIEKIEKTFQPVFIESEEFSITIDPMKKEADGKAKETYTIKLDEDSISKESKILERPPILPEEHIVKPQVDLNTPIRPPRQKYHVYEDIDQPINVSKITTEFIKNEMQFAASTDDSHNVNKPSPDKILTKSAEKLRLKRKEKKLFAFLSKKHSKDTEESEEESSKQEIIEKHDKEVSKEIKENVEKSRKSKTQKYELEKKATVPELSKEVLQHMEDSRVFLVEEINRYVSFPPEKVANVNLEEKAKLEVEDNSVYSEKKSGFLSLFSKKPKKDQFVEEMPISVESTAEPVSEEIQKAHGKVFLTSELNNYEDLKIPPVENIPTLSTEDVEVTISKEVKPSKTAISIDYCYDFINTEVEKYFSYHPEVKALSEKPERSKEKPSFFGIFGKKQKSKEVEELSVPVELNEEVKKNIKDSDLFLQTEVQQFEDVKFHPKAVENVMEEVQKQMSVNSELIDESLKQTSETKTILPSNSSKMSAKPIETAQVIKDSDFFLKTEVREFEDVKYVPREVKIVEDEIEETESRMNPILSLFGKKSRKQTTLPSKEERLSKKALEDMNDTQLFLHEEVQKYFSYKPEAEKIKPDVENQAKNTDTDKIKIEKSILPEDTLKKMEDNARFLNEEVERYYSFKPDIVDVIPNKRERSPTKLKKHEKEHKKGFFGLFSKKHKSEEISANFSEEAKHDMEMSKVFLNTEIEKYNDVKTVFEQPISAERIEKPEDEKTRTFNLLSQKSEKEVTPPPKDVLVKISAETAKNITDSQLFLKEEVNKYLSYKPDIIEKENTIEKEKMTLSLKATDILEATKNINDTDRFLKEEVAKYISFKPEESEMVSTKNPEETGKQVSDTTSFLITEIEKYDDVRFVAVDKEYGKKTSSLDCSPKKTEEHDENVKFSKPKLSSEVEKLIENTNQFLFTEVKNYYGNKYVSSLTKEEELKKQKTVHLSKTESEEEATKSSFFGLFGKKSKKLVEEKLQGISDTALRSINETQNFLCKEISNYNDVKPVVKNVEKVETTQAEEARSEDPEEEKKGFFALFYRKPKKYSSKSDESEHDEEDMQARKQRVLKEMYDTSKFLDEEISRYYDNKSKIKEPHLHSVELLEISKTTQDNVSTEAKDNEAIKSVEQQQPKLDVKYEKLASNRERKKSGSPFRLFNKKSKSEEREVAPTKPLVLSDEVIKAMNDSQAFLSNEVKNYNDYKIQVQVADKENEEEFIELESKSTSLFSIFSKKDVKDSPRTTRKKPKKSKKSHSKERTISPEKKVLSDTEDSSEESRMKGFLSKIGGKLTGKVDEAIIDKQQLDILVAEVDELKVKSEGEKELEVVNLASYEDELDPVINKVSHAVYEVEQNSTDIIKSVEEYIKDEVNKIDKKAVTETTKSAENVEKFSKKSEGILAKFSKKITGKLDDSKKKLKDGENVSAAKDDETIKKETDFLESVSESAKDIVDENLRIAVETAESLLRANEKPEKIVNDFEVPENEACKERTTIKNVLEDSNIEQKIEVKAQKSHEALKEGIEKPSKRSTGFFSKIGKKISEKVDNIKDTIKEAEQETNENKERLLQKVENVEPKVKETKEVINKVIHDESAVQDDLNILNTIVVKEVEQKFVKGETEPDADVEKRIKELFKETDYTGDLSKFEKTITEKIEDTEEKILSAFYDEEKTINAESIKTGDEIRKTEKLLEDTEKSQTSEISDTMKRSEASEEGLRDLSKTIREDPVSMSIKIEEKFQEKPDKLKESSTEGEEGEKAEKRFSGGFLIKLGKKLAGKSEETEKRAATVFYDFDADISDTRKATDITTKDNSEKLLCDVERKQEETTDIKATEKSEQRIATCPNTDTTDYVSIKPSSTSFDTQHAVVDVSNHKNKKIEEGETETEKTTDTAKQTVITNMKQLENEVAVNSKKVKDEAEISGKRSSGFFSKIGKKKSVKAEEITTETASEIANKIKETKVLLDETAKGVTENIEETNKSNLENIDVFTEQKIENVKKVTGDGEKIVKEAGEKVEKITKEVEKGTKGAAAVVINEGEKVTKDVGGFFSKFGKKISGKVNETKQKQEIVKMNVDKSQDDKYLVIKETGENAEKCETKVSIVGTENQQTSTVAEAKELGTEIMVTLDDTAQQFVNEVEELKNTYKITKTITEKVAEDIEDNSESAVKFYKDDVIKNLEKTEITAEVNKENLQIVDQQTTETIENIFEDTKHFDQNVEVKLQDTAEKVTQKAQHSVAANENIEQTVKRTGGFLSKIGKKISGKVDDVKQFTKDSQKQIEDRFQSSSKVTADQLDSEIKEAVNITEQCLKHETEQKKDNLKYVTESLKEAMVETKEYVEGAEEVAPEIVEFINVADANKEAGKVTKENIVSTSLKTKDQTVQKLEKKVTEVTEKTNKSASSFLGKISKKLVGKAENTKEVSKEASADIIATACQTKQDIKETIEIKEELKSASKHLKEAAEVVPKDIEQEKKKVEENIVQDCKAREEEEAETVSDTANKIFFMRSEDIKKSAKDIENITKTLPQELENELPFVKGGECDFKNRLQEVDQKNQENVLQFKGVIDATKQFLDEAQYTMDVGNNKTDAEVEEVKKTLENPTKNSDGFLVKLSKKIIGKAENPKKIPRGAECQTTSALNDNRVNDKYLIEELGERLPNENESLTQKNDEDLVPTTKITKEELTSNQTITKDQKEKSGNFFRKLGKKFVSTAEDTKEKVAQAVGDVEDETNETVQKNKDKLNEIEKKVTETAKEVSKNVNDRTDEVEQNIRKGVVVLAKQSSEELQEKLREKEQEILEGLEQLEEQVKVAKTVSKSVEHDDEQKANSTYDSKERIEEKVEQKEHELFTNDDKTCKKVKGFDDITEDFLTQLREDVRAATVNVENTFKDDVEHTNDIVKATTKESNNKVPPNLSDSVTNKKEDIEKKTVMFAESMEEYAEVKLDSLQNKITGIAADFKTETDNLSTKYSQYKDTAVSAFSDVLKLPEEVARATADFVFQEAKHTDKLFSKDDILTGRLSPKTHNKMTRAASDYSGRTKLDDTKISEANVDLSELPVDSEGKPYVTSPSVKRRVQSQRFPKGERPELVEVTHAIVDISSDDDDYIVTEPLEDIQHKRKPLFHIASEDDDPMQIEQKRRGSSKSNILESLTEQDVETLLTGLQQSVEQPTIATIGNVNVISDVGGDTKTEVNTLEPQLRDLDKDSGSLEPEAVPDDEKLERKLKRVERKFERMASEVMEKEKQQKITTPEFEERQETEFRKIVSQLSTEEVSDFQKEYLTLWDDQTLSPSDEWGSKTPDSQADVQELPKGSY